MPDATSPLSSFAEEVAQQVEDEAEQELPSGFVAWRPEDLPEDFSASGEDPGAPPEEFDNPYWISGDGWMEEEEVPFGHVMRWVDPDEVEA